MNAAVASCFSINARQACLCHSRPKNSELSGRRWDRHRRPVRGSTVRRTVALHFALR